MAFRARGTLVEKYREELADLPAVYFGECLPGVFQRTGDTVGCTRSRPESRQTVYVTGRAQLLNAASQLLWGRVNAVVPANAPSIEKSISPLS